MNQTIFISIPIEELIERLSSSLKDVLELDPPDALTNEQSDWLTRKQAAKYLSVSFPTLSEWTKQGLIKGHRISTRVRYRKSELNQCFTEIKSAKRLGANQSSFQKTKRTTLC
jgi:excisionase family DNA binding protein